MCVSPINKVVTNGICTRNFATATCRLYTVPKFTPTSMNLEVTGKRNKQKKQTEPRPLLDESINGRKLCKSVHAPVEKGWSAIGFTLGFVLLDVGEALTGEFLVLYDPPADFERGYQGAVFSVVVEETKGVNLIGDSNCVAVRRGPGVIEVLV